MVNGHIDDIAAEAAPGNDYAQPPHLLRNVAGAHFEEIAAQVGAAFTQPRVGRGVATADFDLDGDIDLLMTENNGPAKLFRNDQISGRQAIRLELQGVQSNRDAIGARVWIEVAGAKQSQRVRSGGSYLSQSELPLAFLNRADRADRVVVDWPSGRTEDSRGSKQAGVTGSSKAKASSTACLSSARTRRSSLRARASNQVAVAYRHYSFSPSPSLRFRIGLAA